MDQLPTGAKVGAYRIDKLLGEGGMGFVYEATHEVLNRRTAIKFLRPELSTNGQVVARFLQEAKAVNLIDHQNIINVYDYGDGADGSVYFVMEYLEGETLDDLMRKRRPMPAALLIHTFTQIARALAAAHAKKIVHRDLKPVNVFVVGRENNPYFIKLLDFGIAQLRGEGAMTGLTVAGSVMGTPQFMSPEQIQGNEVDLRTDVWAFGVMLYRAATGAAPFKGETFAELAGKILLDDIPKPDGVKPELAKLIASCLERELDKRCADMAAVLAGLDAVKAAYGLDDDGVHRAVLEDAGALTEPLPVMKSEPTRASLAGSLPQYQGVGAGPAAHAPARKSKLPLVLGGVAVVAALGVGAYAMKGGGGAANKPEPPVAAPTEPQAKPAEPPKVNETPAEAAKRELEQALASGNLQEQGQAVDAMALVVSPAMVPFLYKALGGAPEVRVKAARALGDLKLPDAAPKVRAALDGSGDKLKVELAAVLYGLGDKDALAILKRGVTDPGMRLVAATALATAGDDKDARPVLAEIADAMPPGREQWRRAEAGLAALGDAKAKAALEGELAQPDAQRAVAAAAELSSLAAGDAKASSYLTRVVADPEFARRGDAAVALAAIGDKSALAWVPDGLKSLDAGERAQAVGVVARLKDSDHAKDLAALATTDKDRSVRLAADAAVLAL
nr:protein kinase [Kofleriaceae bacterium]